VANEIRDAKDGLKALMEQIDGLRVYDHFPLSVNEHPAAVLMFESRTVGGADGVALAGSSFFGTIRMILVLRMGDPLEATDEIDLYCDPLGSKSIEAQVDGDTTWGEKVDSGKLISIEDVGWREVPSGSGGHYMAADFMFRFIKQVST
jgi:hypothetical protein